MKTKSKIGGHIIRSTAYAVLLSLAFIAASSAFQSPNESNKFAKATGRYDSAAKSPSQPRALSFAERVVYQRAIEEVYWRHRIWPRNSGENPDPKPSLDAVMTQTQLEKKVTDYLRDSQKLADYWQRPITADQLQAEMDRMARDTKQPEVLRELFEALGNDPAVIAECLAKPISAERLIADLSARDESPQVGSSETDAIRTRSVVTRLGQVAYTLPKIADAADPPCTDQWAATTTTNAPRARSEHTAVWTGSEMIVWGGFNCSHAVNTGGQYNPSTDRWAGTSTTNAPDARISHTAVWTGSEMIVWGGAAFFGNTKTGGSYCAPELPAQLGNISTRAFVQTGDDVMIGGFIVQGTEPKRVIVRAIGPELIPFGVHNALADPTLELHDGAGALIASNDNWQDTISAESLPVTRPKIS